MTIPDITPNAVAINTRLIGSGTGDMGGRALVAVVVRVVIGVFVAVVVRVVIGVFVAVVVGVVIGVFVAVVVGVVVSVVV
jgi:hypothetical protein